MKTLWVVTLLLCWPLAAWGQKLEVPAEVRGTPGAFIRIDAKTDGKVVKWRAVDPGLNVFPSDLLKSTTSTVVTGQAGRYRLWAVSALGDVPSDPAVCVVVIGDPDPGPGPVPPVPPGPTPGPAPIPEPGFRAIMIYESAELSMLPASQLAVMHAAEVYAYLNAKCVKGPDGKTAEWRVWDKDVNTASESKVWQEAMKRPRKSLPWLIVSNPAKAGGFEGPLPMTVAETLTLLKKWGGE